MTKQGKTTGNLKMRSGPGMEFEPPIAFLVPDTELEILGEQGEWWHVRAAGKEGFVGKHYVAVSESLGAEVAAAATAASASAVAAKEAPANAAPAPVAKETQPLNRESALARDGGQVTGREASGGGSISKQSGREAGERDHRGVDEK
jgi:hypothetical protein